MSVRPSAMEPAVLSGSCLPARSSPLAGRTPSVEAARGCVSESRARAGRASAPQPSQVGLSTGEATAGCARAWSRNSDFFSTDLCRRPGCYAAPVSSPRNPGCYCCAACRQAVRNVEDRERKWLSRAKLTGRQKRAFEYRAARQRRAPASGGGSGPSPPPPPRPSSRRTSRRSSLIDRPLRA